MLPSTSTAPVSTPNKRTRHPSGVRSRLWPHEDRKWQVLAHTCVCLSNCVREDTQLVSATPGKFAYFSYLSSAAGVFGENTRVAARREPWVWSCAKCCEVLFLFFAVLFLTPPSFFFFSCTAPLYMCIKEKVRDLSAYLHVWVHCKQDVQ